MIDISILVLKNAVPASVADAAYVFSIVNDLLERSGREPLFRVRLVGLSREVRLNQFTIKPDVTMEEVERTDLIIIPSMTGDALAATYINKDFAPWIVDMYKDRGAEVASFCVGAFLLAFTGLLSGHQCTTHWAYANEFRYYYPDIDLVDEKVITHHQGLYSSGGNNAYWNLLLFLVEKYAGREIAIHTAKFFVVDLDRTIQSPFIIFAGQKNHRDEAIKKAQEYIEQNYAESLSVDKIADTFNVSRRTFERRFKKATRNTVVEYIQRVKIEATKKQLEIGRKSIHDVMYEVGYADIKTFREVFRKVTGMTPNEYRNKYNALQA
ncbi:GlxA family transcriptional regulator [Dinghuibacter silviterrae]|uniref:Transcriptional regulator GlxA family with amidase domain n=1 Tax=Dinghuibacter silviterrae TaxID=1539049 RepID=A0A4R8DHK0_9BACT|nr:helix-turn-helix domain-containing protein [Dinghuibacter silviterrae]TDW97199.1 transcriptional regulator GlxA family with amidase domain [Dinghuibacter silviterrae]